MDTTTITQSDEFWANSSIDILFHPERLSEFFPGHDHTRKEKLNAIMRLFIISGILAGMYSQDIMWVFNFVSAGAILTVFLYIGVSAKEKENANQENIRIIQMGGDGGGGGGGGGGGSGSSKKYGADALTGNACVLPTPDNPFMNVALDDYRNDPNRPPACSPDTLLNSGRTVGDETEVQFSKNLFMDVGDLFGSNNSRRQFYTNPSTTIPSNQNEFAQWLYGDAKSCKDNKKDCVPYERLQQKRFYFPDETVNPVTSGI
jgi:hypothetical protein